MPPIVSSRRLSATVTAPYAHAVGSSGSYCRAEQSRPGTKTVCSPGLGMISTLGQRTDTHRRAPTPRSRTRWPPARPVRVATPSLDVLGGCLGEAAELTDRRGSAGPRCGRRPHAAWWLLPGSRASRPSPVRKALGAAVMGSTPSDRRRCVSSSESPGSPSPRDETPRGTQRGSGAANRRREPRHRGCSRLVHPGEPMARRRGRPPRRLRRGSRRSLRSLMRGWTAGAPGWPGRVPQLRTKPYSASSLPIWVRPTRPSSSCRPSGPPGMSSGAPSRRWLVACSSVRTS